MMTKIIRLCGITFFISLAAVSVFFSLAGREFDVPHFAKLLAIPSFFEDRFYDLRMLQTMNKNEIDPRIVLAKIDDESLEKIGRFPWTRTVYVKLLDKLQKFGAKVVAFDIFFPESELACNAAPPDEAFGNAIKQFQEKGGKVILAYSLDVDGAKSEREFSELPEDLYNFVIDTKQTEGMNLKAMTVSRDIYPNKTLLSSGPGLSHIETTSDPDGIFRHYNLVGNVDTLYLPSFALQAYQYYTGNPVVLEMLAVGDANLKLQEGTVKLNSRGETRVRWFGDENQFPSVAIHKILNAKDNDPEMIKTFKNNSVFVASTAFGAHDLRHTPVNSMMPGIYFHMNMMNMLLEGRFFKSQADSTFYSWVILLLGTITMLVVQLLKHPVWDLFTVNLLAFGLFYYDVYILIPQGYEIKLFFCLFSIISCYSWNTFLNFYLSNKDKAFLKSAFGNYISPELIDIMYKGGQAPKLGGDQGMRTAYFTDIAGFSTFSEKLNPTQLVELLNEYLTAMTDILLEEGGTLDKYEGDAIIAFFGAPMPLPDHAIRACRVASRMQNRLGELREKWKNEKDKWPKIVQEMRMRIGINSGEIVTGNMGSKSRMNYTMMGDSVNLAARLEAAAKQYGIYTQVSSMCKDITEDKFEFREIDTIRVMGKSQPVTTFDLLGIKGETAPHLLELKEKFNSGISLYKAQKWDEAIALFTLTLELENKRYPELSHKTNPSKIYIERCQEFKKIPAPPDWDGVYSLTEK